MSTSQFKTIHATITDVRTGEVIVQRLERNLRFAQGNLSLREQAHTQADLDLARAELEAQRGFAKGELFVAVASTEVR